MRRVSSVPALYLCLLAILALETFSTATRGADTPTAPPKGVGALATLADAVRDALAPPPRDAIVVVALPKSDVSLTRGDELSVRVGALVAGKLGARAHDKPAPLGAARALLSSARVSSLVFVQPEIDKGAVRLVVDVYPSVRNGWDRVKNPAPGPVAHGFVTAPIDAEVRSFLPPILLEQGKVTRARHGEGEIAAIACGDVDGDGSLEIAVVSSKRIALGRLVAGPLPGAALVLAVHRSAALADLIPRAPVPSRELLAGVTIAGGAHGALLLGTSDRGGASLAADLGVRHGLTGIPVPGGTSCATVVAEASAFAGLRPCSPVHSKAVDSALPARFDAIAELAYVDARGEGHRAIAVREPSAKLRVRIDDAEVYAVEGVGAQLALADLDLDGVPELVTSTAEGDDRLVVTSLDRAPKVRFRADAKDGVRALAACPSETGGKPVLVASVGQEIWLVR